ERDGGRGLRRRLEQRELLGDDKALSAHSLDRDRYEGAELDELLVQRFAVLRVGDPRERAAGAARAEQAVSAVAGQQLVPELLPLRHVARKHLVREQALEKVVVANVALTPRKADNAADGQCLERSAHGVLRRAEPILRRAALTLEVGRGKRTFRSDPF